MNKISKFLFCLILFFSTGCFLFATQDNDLYSNDLYSSDLYSTDLYSNDLYSNDLYSISFYCNSKKTSKENNSPKLVLVGSYTGSYANSKINSSVSSHINSVVDTRIDSVTNAYIGKGDKFIISQNQAYFVQNFQNWQLQYTGTDFWEDMDARENYIDSLYAAAKIKFGIGATLIFVPYIVSSLTPDGGTIAVCATIVYKNAAKWAIGVAAEEAIRSIAINIIENSDADFFIADVVNSSADGFLIGAVIGTANGVSKIKGLKPLTDNLGATDDLKALSTAKFYNSKGLLFDNHGKEIGKVFANTEGKALYYQLRETKQLYTLADEKIESIITTPNNALYYTTNGVLKNIETGDIIGNIQEKNNIKFIFDNDMNRPIAAINPQNILITNNNLKNAGVSNASLATLYSDLADPKASNYYRALYAFNNPSVKLSKGDVIHHSIEKQVLERYPGAFTEFEVLRDPTTFRGIPKSANNDIHLSQIRKIWDNTYDHINEILYQNQGSWSYNKQKDFIRKTIFEKRDEIDKQVFNYFIENNL